MEAIDYISTHTCSTQLLSYAFNQVGSSYSKTVSRTLMGYIISTVLIGLSNVGLIKLLVLPAKVYDIESVPLKNNDFNKKGGKYNDMDR